MHIDWSKAPEGATHYHPMTCQVGGGVSDHWFKPGFFCVVGFESNGWVPDISPLQDRSGYIAKLEDWKGEGLPPVGTVCEAQDWVNGDTPSWRQTKVIAHHLGFAVETSSADGDDVEVGVCAAGDFRPIRTPEQIKAEERETELNRMVATVSMLDKGWARKVCAGLYDAGYRKFEIVEGE